MSMIEVSATERRLAERVTAESASVVSLSQGAGGLEFTNMSQAMEFAKIMAVSGIAIPLHLRGNVGACMAITIQAVEWRLSPFAVANKSYEVNGRMAYESQLIQAVVLQRAPIKGRFKVEFTGEGITRKCTVAATLREGSAVDYTSPEIGTIKVQNSPLWKSDPDQQLFYYSGRALCRRHFPDVLLGIYTPDELYDSQEPRRPEYARDVTPKGLNAKLDALAPAGSGEPPHDSVTGEITSATEPETPAGDTEKDAGTSSPPSDAPASDPVLQKLLDEGRGAATGGAAQFKRWYGRLNAPDAARIEPHVAALRQAAMAIDGDRS